MSSCELTTFDLDLRYVTGTTGGRHSHFQLPYWREEAFEENNLSKEPGETGERMERRKGGKEKGKKEWKKIRKGWE